MFSRLKLGNLLAKYITADQDSRIRAAAEFVSKPDQELESDTRHLGEDQRKCIKRKPVVLDMMSSSTKSFPENYSQE